MKIIIDLDRPLPEITAQFSAAIDTIRQKFGWDALAQIIETMVLQLALSEWSHKAPDSIGRLKRIHRAICPQQQ
jgi:hypothetical protein